MAKAANGTLLIVNADDLGATVPVNDAIFALMEERLVTSATVMANGEGFADAASRLRRYSQCSFGVHLNLTAFAPLRPTRELEPILDAGGEMSKARLDKVAWTPVLRDAIYVELSAQVQRCLDAGIKVSHFDSHHHTHTNPRLLPVLRKLRRTFGVTRVRGTINIIPAPAMDWRRMAKKTMYGLLMKLYVGARSPEGMGSFFDFYARVQKEMPFDWRSIELMVHPGSTSPNGTYEEMLLRKGWLSQLPFEARLGTYFDL